MKKIVYGIFLGLIALQSFGQKGRVASGDRDYARYAYIDAITTYERVAEKGYKDEGMFQKLGNAYYFNAELEKAAKWYGALFEMNPNQESEYYYRYSQSLKALGDYPKADTMLELFNKKSGNDLRAKLFKENRNYLEIIKANSGRFKIEDAGINSEMSDYGSSFYDKNLVFASSRDTGLVSKKVFRWTNQSFTNLYMSELDEEGKLSGPKRFSKKINSKFHESTPVFTKDGKTMYFTRNNYLNGKKGKDRERITLLKIYRATLEDGEWKNVYELPFNSDQYSVAHPALSLDEKTLYFTSDMPGTLGQSDLFKVEIKANGTFGKPVNLGTAVNTEGRETFPYISGDNELYFASDGRPGLGGLDIFVTKILDANNFGEVQNIGEPINSADDDFAYLIDSKNRNGYFTSNRPGGKGYDDIYKFQELRRLICEQLLVGTITDKDTKEVLVSSKVSLFDSDFNFLGETFTDENGRYQFNVMCGKKYYVRAEKENYGSEEKSITIENKSGKTEFPLSLELLVKKVEVGTDLAKILNIPIIYFDLDKSVIRKDASFELAKVLAVMQEYPKMKIDIRSHTDCRQTAAYNMSLSDRRAKSTMGWLVKQGIDKSRLTAKGYGESQLVNNCGCEPTNDSPCTEAQHQENRRSEFIIISID